MKFKSLKLAAVVLSVCFLSFFAAGNAMAVFSDNGATVYGLSIVRLNGDGVLAATLVTDTNYAKATDLITGSVTSTTSPSAIAVSGVAHAQSNTNIYGGLNFIYDSGNTTSSGIGNVVDKGAFVLDTFNYAGKLSSQFDNNKATAIAKATMNWSFYQVSGGESTYQFIVYANLWSSGSAKCHVGADASGNPSLEIIFNSTTPTETRNGDWKVDTTNSVLHPKTWSDGSNGNENVFTKQFTFDTGVNNGSGTLGIIYSSTGVADCPVPLPPSLLLLAPGLLGLVGLRKRIA